MEVTEMRSNVLCQEGTWKRRQQGWMIVVQGPTQLDPIVVFQALSVDSFIDLLLWVSIICPISLMSRMVTKKKKKLSRTHRGHRS